MSKLSSEIISEIYIYVLNGSLIKNLYIDKGTSWGFIYETPFDDYDNMPLLEYLKNGNKHV